MAIFDARGEKGAAGHPRRIPPGRRGIVGDGGERPGHSLRANANQIGRLSVGFGRARQGHKEDEGHRDQTHRGPGGVEHAPYLTRFVSFVFLCVLVYDAPLASRYATRTAAATTVVQRPFLSPTAVCVTFCVRTISFEGD